MKRIWFPESKKTITIISLALLSIVHTNVTLAQQASKKPVKKHELYGHSFNAGLGPGYPGRWLLPAPYFSVNYEFDVARNFTLAPFAGFSSYRSDPNYIKGVPYYYRASILPMGVKGTYYFDDLLNASSKWDFYAGASLGYALVHLSWDSFYPGDEKSLPGITPLYLQLHAGAEYHINHKAGLFLDVSTGGSLAGIAIHGMR